MVTKAPRRPTSAAVSLAALMFVSCQQPTRPPANSARGDSTENTFHRIRTSGVLRVGYLVAPPWVIRDPNNGLLSGTNIDAVQEIARLMEVRLEFTEATLATFAAGLQSRRFDLSVCPTFATIPRAKAVAFTRPQMYIGNSAIARKGDTRFQSVSDIDRPGIVVAVTQGEAGQEYAKANFKSAEVKVLSVGADQALTFSEVLAGRADIALGDAWFTAHFAATHPKASDVFADQPYDLTPVAWAVRYEDADLLGFINTALEYMESTGKLAALDRKYGAKWLRPARTWVKS